MQRLFAVLAIITSLLLPSTLPAGEGAKPVVSVMEVGIDGQISAAQVYILRRAVREAVASNADAILINMDTPGGDVSSMLEMMEIISDFGGKTICYVNPNAVSAGSFIATSCGEIWFAPKGVMGAAEAVSGDGKDIDASMARKVKSFLAAKARVFAGDENPNRALVQTAMMDPDMELEIDGRLIKKKGELLSVTAKEAVEEYGGHPLLADGVAKDTGELLEKSFGPGRKFETVHFKISPLETAAKFVSMVSPLLMGLGIFLLIIEFKTGGFGLMGILALCMLAVVFFGAHVAGLAGYEVPLLFLIGVLLLLVEAFLLPGFFVFGVAGLVMMVLALVLAGANPMPSEGLVPNLESLSSGIAQFMAALGVAVVLLAVFGRYFKNTALWRMFVLDGGLGNGTQGALDSGLEGMRGVVLAALVPNGKVLVGGKSYDATNADGTFLEKGAEIEVVSRDSFKLEVRKAGR